MKVSVISATYNRSHLLYEILEQWKKVDAHTKYEYEIIFSDDASSDETVQILKEYKGLPLVILENEHGGAAKARNHALEVAKGEVIIFTGDDIFPEVDFINKHYESYLKHGKDIATLGRVEWHRDIRLNHLMKHITEIGCEQFGFIGLKPYGITDFRHFYTCNISVAREKLNELEVLFDLTFDKYGFEDIELGYRLYKNGMNIYYDPSIVAEHHHIYDSVDKFCVRQATAGEELAIFKRLHPGLNRQEIKFDIDGFIKDYNEWCKAPSSNRIGTIGMVGMKVGITVTKIIEYILAKRDSNTLKMLCSKIYGKVFAIHMFAGLACGIDREPLQSKHFKYAVRYLAYGDAQIFVDEDNNFSEERSYRFSTVGRNCIKLDLNVEGQNVRRIRFDPLSEQCRIEIKEAYIILENGHKVNLEFEYNNAVSVQGPHYDFTNQIDPILISKQYEEPIKQISISYNIQYFTAEKYRKLIKKSIKKGYDYTKKGIKKLLSNETKIVEPTKGERIELSLESNKKIWLKTTEEVVEQYKKICSIFGAEIKVSTEDKTVDEYIQYTYMPNSSEGALDNLQLLNTVFALLNYKYDYIIVSNGLEYFPVIKTTDIRNSLFLSENISSLEELKVSGKSGKLLRIPGKKQVEEEINLIELIPNIKCESMSNLYFEGLSIKSVNTDYKVQAIQNSKPVIFVLPVFMAVGGVEKNTIEIMSKLKDKYQFVVITYENHRFEQGCLYNKLYDIDVIYYDLGQTSRFDDYFNILEKLKQMYNPKLVWICNSNPWMSNNSELTRKTFYEMPIVMQDAYDEVNGWIQHYDKPGIQACDRFIAINTKIKERFINDFNIKEEDIDLVYSATDVSKHKRINVNKFDREAVLNQYGLESSKKQFAYIGRVTEQKRPLVFIELAKRLLDTYEDVEFTMVGNGELGDAVDELINKYELQNKIHRVKYIDNIQEFIKALDGLIVTSTFEGLPIVTIDAMGVGTPIMSTDVGDVKLFIDRYNNGIIAKDLSIETLEETFKEFYEQLGDYKKNAERSIEDVIYFFSADRAARLMEECFTKAQEKYFR